MLKLKPVVIAISLVFFLCHSWLIRVQSSPALEVSLNSADDIDPHDDAAIAVSTVNDQVIVGTSKVVKGSSAGPGKGDALVAYYFSSDGGHTWGTALLSLDTPQKTWSRATDPTVACDRNGVFYLGALLLDNANFDTGVYVYKSTDGGHTFTNPTAAAVDIGNLTNPTRAGKPRITVDTSSSSPFQNTVYAVWTSTAIDEFGQNSTVPTVARRRPGDSVFSTPKPIGHAGDYRGPALATGPNGEFCAAFVGMPSRSLYFNASTDGGDTFLQGFGSIAVDLHDFTGSLDGPNAPLLIDGLPRQNSFPAIDIDRSNGPSRGSVYIAWAETTNHIDTDIFLVRVTLRGNIIPEVTTPIKVNNNGGGSDQFMPWLSVDPSDGSVQLVFYDRRDTSGTVLMNTYLARSTDGGVSFGENIRISTAPSDPRVQADIAAKNSTAIGMGDYIGISANRGKSHLLWSDTRHGKQEIFYGLVDFGSSPPPPPATGTDDCSSPRVIPGIPFQESVDTSSATSSASDPVSCSGTRDTNSVWYSLTATANTTYGIETLQSDYNTVLSVFSGNCAALVPIACSDDISNPANAGTRSLLTFAAQQGTTYLIEVSGKGAGGGLKLRAGYPTITNIELTDAPFGDALKITGAGFTSQNIAVTAQKDGEDIPLPNVFFVGPSGGDGTDTVIYASKKKVRKLVKRGVITVRIESPAGSGNVSNSFNFTR